MAPGLFETLRALQDAGIPSGLKVDDEGITAWVQHFAHDRIDKVTWMGVTNDGPPGSSANVTWADEAMVATCCWKARCARGHRTRRTAPCIACWSRSGRDDTKEEPMPLKSWTAFHQAHGRPCILFADLLSPRRRQSKYSLLGSLADALKLKGDYALLPEKETIRMVFEREDDARAVAEPLLARRTGREGGWAVQWTFVFDEPMEDKIKAALPAAKPRAVRRAG